MKYLDELKKQSKSTQQDLEIQKKDEQIQLRILHSLQPRLRSILEYLEELVSILNEVKPQMTVSYEIEGYGSLTDLHQQAYSVQVSNRENIRNITLNFECLDEKLDERTFTVEGRDAFHQQREYMWRNNLRFNDKFTADGRGMFFLEPKIHVQLIFTPDTIQDKIKLQMCNYFGIGRTERWIAPAHINQDSLDRDLGGLILRKTNDLVELSTGRLTDDMRKKIQETLQLEQEEQRRIDERLAAEEQAQHEVRLVNKVRSNLNALVRKK